MKNPHDEIREIAQRLLALAERLAHSTTETRMPGLAERLDALSLPDQFPLSLPAEQLGITHSGARHLGALLRARGYRRVHTGKERVWLKPGAVLQTSNPVSLEMASRMVSFPDTIRISAVYERLGLSESMVHPARLARALRIAGYTKVGRWDWVRRATLDSKVGAP
jgi:hypothetical protein